MNYIITGRPEVFAQVGEYNYADVDILASLPKIVGTDTETPGLYPLDHNEGPFSLQLGDGYNNYILDMETIDFESVRPYLENKTLIFHNASFDLGWMYVHWNFWPKEVGDTMLASMILHNGKKERNGAPYRHGFGYVMERELGIEYDKSEQKNIHKIRFSTQRSIQYMFNDVDRLLDLHADLVRKLTENEQIPTYRLHRRYIRAMAYMEQCGLPVSPEKWREKMELDKLELAEKEKVVVEYIYAHCPHFQDNQGDLFSSASKVSVNLSSAKQMVHVFESFGINVDVPDDKDKTKTKKSTKEEVISKSDHPFVKLWLEMQAIKHDVTTYGQNLLDRIKNNAFYTTFKPILDTARIATRREGINIMNFPKGEKTRSCFVAREGYQMVVCDYSGQENCTTADITEDAAMISSIVNGDCLHCAFARVLNPEIAHCTDEEIMTIHKDKRQEAKAPRFLFSYGGNAHTLHENEGVPKERAEEIEAAYKELHSGIYEYGSRKYEEAIELGYIHSTSGFRLYLPDYEEFLKYKKKVEGFDSEFWKIYRVGKAESRAKWEAEEVGEQYQIQDWEAYSLYKDNREIVSRFFKKKSEYLKLCKNNPSQATAAHQTKEAAARIFDHIIDNGHQWKARISAIQHDEMVMEVADELVEEYKEVVERNMKEGGDIFLTHDYFKMSCEAHAGPDWESAKTPPKVEETPAEEVI